MKWEKFYNNQKVLYKYMKDYANDILESENFVKTNEFLQHGNITVNKHSIHVAKCSLDITNKLRIKCNQKELIRGALLHDYFLYDWHDKDLIHPHRLHGFHHPKKAVINALKEYDLTSREKDIIKKHMWPLTIIPPVCREAWIVTLVDRWCAL